MFRPLPLPALLLGLAGLIPFVACGLITLSSTTPMAGQALTMLLAYGAVILSFLGGVQWGFVLREDGAPLARVRLSLGVVPALIGWLALLVPLLLPIDVALAVLIAGYILTLAVEAQAQRRGLVPPGYLPMRWLLTAVVVIVLVTVLVLRLAGARLVL